MSQRLNEQNTSRGWTQILGSTKGSDESLYVYVFDFRDGQRKSFACRVPSSLIELSVSAEIKDKVFKSTLPSLIGKVADTMQTPQDESDLICLLAVYIQSSVIEQIDDIKTNASGIHPAVIINVHTSQYGDFMFPLCVPHEDPFLDFAQANEFSDGLYSLSQHASPQLFQPADVKVLQ